MERIPQHDRLLPPGLVRLADLVREQLGWPAWSRHQLQQFALRGPVLKAISTHSDFSSAWAALAPGLEVAATGGHPDPCVWATGCWDCQRGLREVAGLNEKLHLAAEHGAKEFFLPASQQGEASQIVAGHGASPSVNPLRMGITEPREVLRPLLARLRACPPHQPTKTTSPPSRPASTTTIFSRSTMSVPMLSTRLTCYRPSLRVSSDAFRNDGQVGNRRTW